MAVLGMVKETLLPCPGTYKNLRQIFGLSYDFSPPACHTLSNRPGGCRPPLLPREDACDRSRICVRTAPPVPTRRSATKGSSSARDVLQSVCWEICFPFQGLG